MNMKNPKNITVRWVRDKFGKFPAAAPCAPYYLLPWGPLPWGPLDGVI